jgi:hypothetical protein
MGCDIHCYGEIKKDGKWEKVGTEFLSCYYDSEKPGVFDKYTDELYEGRNYDLFGILAGVRNSCLETIDFARGIPSDVSDEVKTHVDYWDTDGHSHSHLTVKEVLEYDWDQSYVSDNSVYLDEYAGYTEYETSLDWVDFEYIEASEAEKLLNGEIARDPNKEYVVMLTERIPYKELVGGNFFDNINKLKELGGEEARIVFWFDS